MKFRKTVCSHESRPGLVGQCSALSQARSQRGVALVLTLIMLSIIVVVTVVFLATTRRNRSSTTVRVDQTTAEFAAEYAYQHATGKIIERMIRDTNLLAFEFFVSRPAGYGYEVDGGGRVLRPLDADAIPRVINPTNGLMHNPDVFLDLGRNREFDDPGGSNRPHGDPIWMGILDRPWTNHLPNNRFVARMAYLVVPAGKTLDLNTIHNDTSPNNGAGYMRNQGVGPWELNLAAFLHELDPVIWDYDYRRVSGKPEAYGTAFGDARSFLNYRHGWPDTPANAPVPADALSFTQVYPEAQFGGFPGMSIDIYADGNLGYPLGADFALPDDDYPLKPQRWAGADTTNHWFHIQEFFDHADVGGFVGRSNKVTFDFYTNLYRAQLGLDLGGNPTRQPNGSLYYKMMSQLGTDTGSDVDDRINLNFVDKSATFTNLTATNFVPWDASPELAIAFFTNVAQRIFLAQSNEFNPVGTNQLPIRSMLEIPVYPTNRYNSAVHRILQMTANIFDATRTNIYPSVFRPVFGKLPGDAETVYIVGYELDDRVSTLYSWLDDNTNGIPLVVGAKKGFPNFNEFTLRSDVLVARKIQVTRPSTAPGTRPDGTNQMYVLGISNYFGAESWNSYDAEKGARAYPRNLQIVASNYARVSMTNSLNFQTNSVQYSAASAFIPGGTWLGGMIGSNAFRLTLNTNMAFLSNAVYVFNGNYFANISTNQFEPNNGFPIPDWVLTVSNRLAYWMTEPGSDRIIDFVLLEDTHTVDLHRDLIGAATGPYAGIAGVSTAIAGLWRTNRAVPNGPTDGILRQIDISLGIAGTTAADWRAFALAATPRENDKLSAIDGFRNFIGLAPIYGVPFVTNTSRAMQTPFNPSAKIAALSTWQVNDPLVHYHPEDLRIDPQTLTNIQYLKPTQSASNVAPSTMGYLNTRYSPWNGNRNAGTYPETGDLTIKDAGVNGSIDWQFPSNKLATAGLLGRVHRGTPWQTIYFKPDVATQTDWGKQSADRVFIPARNQVISRSHPTNDWLLLDMFTTSIDERTSRGLVSINQTNMETWSALMSGVVVVSNSLRTAVLGDPREYEELYIQPFGNGDPGTNGFFQIWTNIYRYQLAKGEPLTSVGELIRSVPELTTKSPFLNLTRADQRNFGIDDFAYEHIPQQIMSLLRVGQPRFVIYAYGQALKPERIDPASGLVVNYQVTAEFATRTVIRVEGDPRSRLRAVVESFNILPPD